MCPKNKAATTSAAEQHEVGCPLPAAVVASIECIRNCCATPFKLSISISFMDIANCMRRLPKGKQNSRAKPQRQGGIKLAILARCGRDVSPKRPCLVRAGRLGGDCPKTAVWEGERAREPGFPPVNPQFVTL